MSNPNADSLSHPEFDKPILPSGLNILTILTFIGCLIQLVFVVLGFANAEKTFRDKDKTLEKMNNPDSPAWVKSMMPKAEDYDTMVTKSLENKIPMLILGLAAVGLCFYGALQMRKLKKSGFPIYLVGQILPYITTALFVGFFMFSGVTFVIATAITVLFILLYLTQRKHLVY